MPTLITKGLGSGPAGTISTSLITKGLWTTVVVDTCGKLPLRPIIVHPEYNPDSYSDIRRFFNPAIFGNNIDSWLYALSIGDNYLKRNAKNLIDNLFVKTAVDEFLDVLGGNVGAVRPSGVGMSDTSFRRVVSETNNNQNTLNSISNVLDIYFSNFQTKAYIESEKSEYFHINDGDNLIIEIDGTKIYKIYFESNDFATDCCATAIEVANAITSKVHNLNGEAFAVPYYDIAGEPRRVRLLSNTIGSRSSVRIMGGTAQNALKFGQFIATTQNGSTMFSITKPNGRTTRVTWTDGEQPSFSALLAGDYVNISGAEFNQNNKGSFPISRVVNGPVNESYFEIMNEQGVVQSDIILIANKDLMFFRPIKRIVGSDLQYANIFETI